MVSSFFHFEPQIAQSAYVHERAVVMGRVTLGERVSVWPGAVLRGDINAITVGDGSNVQDNSVVHVADDHPVVIGRDVVVGHAACVHGATIGDGCLVGIGAIVLNGAVVGDESILASGCLVPEGAVLEGGHLYMGSPAKARRPLSPEERLGIRQMARKYTHVARGHRSSEEAVAQGSRLGRDAWVALERAMHDPSGEA